MHTRRCANAIGLTPLTNDRTACDRYAYSGHSDSRVSQADLGLGLGLGPEGGLGAGLGAGLDGYVAKQAGTPSTASATPAKASDCKVGAAAGVEDERRTMVEPNAYAVDEAQIGFGEAGGGEAEYMEPTPGGARRVSAVSNPSNATADGLVVRPTTASASDEGYLKFGDLPADECVTEHKKSTKKNSGSCADTFRLQSVRRSNPLADADAGAGAGAGAGAAPGGFAAF